MTTGGTRKDNLRWLSLAGALILHTFILLAVVVLPFLVYDAISSSSLREVSGLELSGGLAYPLYIAYWFSKLKNFRAKFILLHLITLLSIAFAAAIASSQFMPLVLASLPTLVAAFPLLGMFSSRARAISGRTTTFLISSLLALPVGVFLSLLFIYSMAMDSVGNMRY